jgi:hypothetical protein
MVEVAHDREAPTGPTAPPPDDPPAASSAGSAGTALRLIATVGSPIAIATGLLFYFGWVRATVQAKRLGYDTAILDWSIQDYILRSVNVLFVPLMALLVVALLLLGVHRLLVLPVVTSGRSGAVASWLPRALRASWLMWVAIGITLVVVAGPMSGAIIPATITLALLCALYGDLLERRVTGTTRTSTAAAALLLILLAFSMFWNTERLARVVGEGYADQIVSNPRQLLAVTVYSPKSLEIDVHGVVETKLGTAESAYRYRYDGLRLVQRSGDRYLLMSERGDAGSSRIIVLRDSDTIRLEFAR